MSTSRLITIASPKRATAALVAALLLTGFAAAWLPLYAAVIVTGGLALAICASIMALRPRNSIVTLTLHADATMAGRTGSGDDAPIDVLSHRIVAGAVVIMRVRIGGRRPSRALVLVPGDQSSADLRALRTHLRLRRPAGVGPGRPRTAVLL